MSIALANALRKGFFAYTNNEKAHNVTRADRIERQVTSYCQDVSVASDSIGVLKGTVKGSKCVDALTRTMAATKPTSKLLEWLGKGANFASQAVNPILCVASAARALSAEDKKSAIIAESGAMLGMFAFEGVAKSAMGLAPVKNKLYNSAAGYILKGLKATNILNKLPNNKYTSILKGAMFVAASCTGFALGGKLGKTIANNTTAKDFEAKKIAKLQKEQAQIAELTAPKDGNLTNAVA